MKNWKPVEGTQMIIDHLFFNGKMTIRQMKLNFISDRYIYRILHLLGSKGLVSQTYVRNFADTGRKYVQAYELTEKGKNYISNGKGDKIMEEKSGKMKVVAVYKWNSNKDDWVLK